MGQPRSEVKNIPEYTVPFLAPVIGAMTMIQDMMEQQYSVVSTMVFTAIGALLFVVDVGTDIWTAAKHLKNHDTNWFLITVLCLLFSTLIVVIFAEYRYREELNSMSLAKKLTLHILGILLFPLIGPILPLKGYWDTLANGWKSRKYGKQGKIRQQKHHYEKMLNVNGRSALLLLVECFTEAAPQLALQLYIMTQISTTENSSKYGAFWWISQSFTAFTSWVSLAWGITAYIRSQRLADETRNNVSLSGSIVILLWRLSWLTARVTAVVVFAAHYQEKVGFVGLVHYMVMVVWLKVSRTFKDYDIDQLGEWAYSIWSGFVFGFDFLPWNHKPNQPTRRHYTFYYTVCEIENVVMLAIFGLNVDPYPFYYKPATVIHCLSFPLSLLFMGLYYRSYHPRYQPVQEGSHPG